MEDDQTRTAKEIEMVVMWRDASFWRSPDTTIPKKAHLLHPTLRGPYGHPVALCNTRIQLDEDNSVPIQEAGILFCKKCCKAKNQK